WISKPGPGRPPIPVETKTLIVRMATENGWRARKIQAELSKLGIHLGLTTISRYLPKVDAGVDPHQRWMTFLRNHRDVIAGMDFFVVPTVRFTLLLVGSCSTTGDGGPPLQRHRPSLGSMDDPTAARDLSRSPEASLSRPGQRRHLLGRGRSHP